MNEQMIRSLNRPTTDSRLLRNFIKRMQRKLDLKRATYIDGEDHRFVGQNLSLPLDFSL